MNVRYKSSHLGEPAQLASQLTSKEQPLRNAFNFVNKVRNVWI